MDIVINHPNFNLRYHDKCEVALKFISLVTTSNLFSLETVQKCQHCQVCVLWENSSEVKVIQNSTFKVVHITSGHNLV